MNKPLRLLTGLILLANMNVALSQIPAAATPAAPAPRVDNSLNGQFYAILRYTEHWQQAPMNAFHKSFMDTLNLEKHKLREANTKLAEQAKTIADLQTSVSAKEQSLADSQTKVNRVSLLGIPLTKSAYNFVMWGLVLILGGSLVTVIYLSASNKREAAFRITEHDVLTSEFAAYKAKANEKEKKLARELQTERNKLEELSGKSSL